MNYPISRLLCSFTFLLCNSSAMAEFADIHRIYQQTPNMQKLEVCQGGGCAKLSVLSLNQADWKPVDQLFATAVENGAQEREKIAQAIGLLEEIVGFKIGTSTDRAGTFDNADYPGQQDCNDEAINTTTYMRLLQQHGYLHFHTIQDFKRRNFFFDGWPHTTAVIRDSETGDEYAVDSWFYDNGHPATVVPLAVWQDDYQPEDSPIGKRD